MRRQAHGASRCQHTGADDTVRLFVSDFISRFQMRFNERGRPRAHRYMDDAARELASAAN